MSDHRHILDSVAATARFDFAIRHCPKCGWSGSLGNATLRYCGFGQRVEGDWGEAFLFGEAGAPSCEGPGEHFHWQCARCRYRRVLPMPHPHRPGVN
jgi:hypothetical protein